MRKKERSQPADKWSLKNEPIKRDLGGAKKWAKLFLSKMFHNFFFIAASLGPRANFERERKWGKDELLPKKRLRSMKYYYGFVRERNFFCASFSPISALQKPSDVYDQKEWRGPRENQRITLTITKLLVTVVGPPN